MLHSQAKILHCMTCPQLLTAWHEAGCSVQVRTFDLVQKSKIFAIGYCFGGGGVLELMRAWPNTPGLLGDPSCRPLLFPGQIILLAHTCTCPCTPGLLERPHRFSSLHSDSAVCSLVHVLAPCACLHCLTAVGINTSSKQ